MRPYLLLGAVFLSCACKTMRAQPSEPRAAVARSVQCGTVDGFKGTCSVTELSGRQDTTTEQARASAFNEVTELVFSVPASSSPGQTRVEFRRKAGVLEEWTIDAALDLYGRTGCIAEVSGGVFGEGFVPRITLRLLLNLQDDARTGFAEVSDHRSGKKVHGTFGLKCDWQK